MSDLLREVDDVMRQERLALIWKEYGNTIIVVLIAIILGTAGGSFYKSWNADVQTHQTNQVLDLIEADNFPDNIDLDNLNLRTDLKSILLLQAAAQSVTEGNLEDANAFYDSLAKLSGKNDLHYGLSAITRSGFEANADNHDKANSLIEPLLGQKSHVWHAHALLNAAIYAADTQQDYDLAISYLDALQTIQIQPPSMAQKAEALRHVYAIKQTENKTQ